MKYVHGNMLDVTKGILVHGCNTHGVMGSGIAKAIKDKWPTSVYEQYHDHCKPFVDAKKHRQLLGTIQITLPSPTLIVVNAFTQHTYGFGERHVDYEAVAKCFECVVKELKPEMGPLYFPLIGAGLGGGSWPVIAMIIEETVPVEFDPTLYLLPGTDIPDKHIAYVPA
jgi:O-acetyl-ADP-ribose deacetylase (regulator of RNase III)